VKNAKKKKMSEGITEKEYQELKDWINSKKHLPPFLRDFHDQKDVFKTIGGMKALHPFPEYSWMDVHAISIDKFLWYMAYYGYTLQKTRTKKSFFNIDGAIKARQDKETESFKLMLEENKKEKNGSNNKSN
jgi:hypothetical protein